jgi:hypothetical protein
MYMYARTHAVTPSIRQAAAALADWWLRRASLGGYTSATLALLTQVGGAYMLVACLPPYASSHRYVIVVICYYM